MGRTDWCRKTTWTEEDQRDFFDRLRRSRVADSKAQYLRIQAETFAHTGDRALLQAALSLLRRSFDQYPDAMDAALAYDLAARCMLRLGEVDEAIAFARKALRREREHPGIRFNAYLTFARAVVERRLSKLYDEVLEVLDAEPEPLFPAHRYVASAARAVIAADRGEATAARSHAKAALAAAAETHSGAAHHPRVGLVENTDTPLHAVLKRLEQE